MRRGLAAFRLAEAGALDRLDDAVDAGGGDEGTGAETPNALNGFLALSGIPLPQQARVDICQMRAYEFSDAFDVFTSVCDG